MEGKILAVVNEKMPVLENLHISKHVIGDKPRPRVCIVTGIHGDELEGQYVCYELARLLNDFSGHINGRIEIYPALNPLGVDSVFRGIPTFDLDMNRIFPGCTDGHVIEKVAHDVIEDLKGADLVIDIHSSNIYLYEVPQVRMSEETAERLMPFAQQLNVDFVWVHAAATVLESTIAHSLNTIGTPTVVVEMGIGMRITPGYGNKLVNGIMNALAHLGVISEDAQREVSTPFVSTAGHVSMINSPASGVVISIASHGSWVEAGETLCIVTDPLRGITLAEVMAPVNGFLFTMRGYPVVYEGSLIARIFSIG
jgi:hypothetical protein